MHSYVPLCWEWCRIKVGILSFQPWLERQYPNFYPSRPKVDQNQRIPHLNICSVWIYYKTLLDNVSEYSPCTLLIIAYIGVITSIVRNFITDICLYFKTMIAVDTDKQLTGHVTRYHLNNNIPLCSALWPTSIVYEFTILKFKTSGQMAFWAPFVWLRRRRRF